MCWDPSLGGEEDAAIVDAQTRKSLCRHVTVYIVAANSGRTLLVSDVRRDTSASQIGVAARYIFNHISRDPRPISVLVPSINALNMSYLTRITRRTPALVRPLSTTPAPRFPSDKLDKPGKPADMNPSCAPLSLSPIPPLTLLRCSQGPETVKRGNEPANDLELDPKKSSEGGAAGSSSFARSTKEPDAAKKPVSNSTPGTTKLD